MSRLKAKFLHFVFLGCSLGRGELLHQCKPAAPPWPGPLGPEYPPLAGSTWRGCVGKCACSVQHKGLAHAACLLQRLFSPFDVIQDTPRNY